MVIDMHNCTFEDDCFWHPAFSTEPASCIVLGVGFHFQVAVKYLRSAKLEVGELGIPYNSSADRKLVNSLLAQLKPKVVLADSDMSIAHFEELWAVCTELKARLILLVPDTDRTLCVVEPDFDLVTLFGDRQLAHSQFLWHNLVLISTAPHPLLVARMHNAGWVGHQNRVH